MRLVVSSRPETYLSYADIPDFGRTCDPTAVMNQSYLVAPQGTVVQVESMQRIGGINFSIGQGLNKDTVTLSPGGMFGQDVLLYGSIGTVSESGTSLDLYDFIVEPYLARFADSPWIFSRARGVRSLEIRCKADGLGDCIRRFQSQSLSNRNSRKTSGIFIRLEARPYRCRAGMTVQPNKCLQEAPALMV